MPSGITDYGTTTWLAVLLQILPSPTSYYVALCSSEPGAAMDGDILSDIEPAGGGYARQRYGIGSANWSLSGNYVTNLNDVAFGIASTDWGQLPNFALCTTPTSGDVFAWGEFITPTFVNAGDRVTVPAGGLVLALSSIDSAIAV